MPLLGWLLLKDHRRPANSLPFEGDIHFDAVGDLDERNASVHPVVLAQRSLSFIFLNVANFKDIRRGQDLREAQTDFEIK